MHIWPAELVRPQHPSKPPQAVAMGPDMPWVSSGALLLLLYLDTVKGDIRFRVKLRKGKSSKRIRKDGACPAPNLCE